MTKFPLFAILLFIGASTFAQTQSEKETNDLLSHKWKLTFVEMGGQKIPPPAEAGDSFLDFKADGSLLQIDTTGEEKAKWTYDHKTKTITTVDKDGTEKYEIIKISETELIVKATEEGMTFNLIMKRVN